MTDYDLAADERVPTLLTVGAFLGGVVLAVAGVLVSWRRWRWSE